MLRFSFAVSRPLLSFLLVLPNSLLRIRLATPPFEAEVLVLLLLFVDDVVATLSRVAALKPFGDAEEEGEDGEERFAAVRGEEWSAVFGLLVGANPLSAPSRTLGAADDDGGGSAIRDMGWLAANGASGVDMSKEEGCCCWL